MADSPGNGVKGAPGLSGPCTIDVGYTTHTHPSQRHSVTVCSLVRDRERTLSPRRSLASDGVAEKRTESIIVVLGEPCSTGCGSVARPCTKNLATAMERLAPCSASF